MVKRTIIIFSVIFCLTRPVASDYSNSVKAIRNNSLRTSIPDKTGELRGGDVRTVPYGTAHLSSSIRFFCAHRTESGCIVKAIKERKNAKTETEKVIDEMGLMARDVRESIARSRAIMLASIDILLAGEDLLCADLLKELQEDRHQFVAELESPEDEEQKNLLDEITTLLSSQPAHLLKAIIESLQGKKSNIIRLGA